MSEGLRKGYTARGSSDVAVRPNSLCYNSSKVLCDATRAVLNSCHEAYALVVGVIAVAVAVAGDDDGDDGSALFFAAFFVVSCRILTPILSFLIP